MVVVPLFLCQSLLFCLFQGQCVRKPNSTEPICECFEGFGGDSCQRVLPTKHEGADALDTSTINTKTPLNPFNVWPFGDLARPMGGLFSDMGRSGSVFGDTSFLKLGGFERGISSTEVINDDKHFLINIDLTGYNPEDIKVSVDGYCLIVKAEQEKEDDGQYIKRSYIRKWYLPDDVNASGIHSSLASNGRLTIEAPKKPHSTGHSPQLQTSDVKEKMLKNKTS